MASGNTDREFVICIRNMGYSASLERRKIYEVVEDEAAGGHSQLRVIDETGEDYLYPADLFIPVNLPRATEDALRRAS